MVSEFYYLHVMFLLQPKTLQDPGIINWPVSKKQNPDSITHKKKKLKKPTKIIHLLGLINFIW